MKALGCQLILELYDCPARLLDDPEHVAGTMLAAVEASGATVIQPFFHQFAPQGVSGVVIISESHFSIHTWPEYGYAALDVFTCGDVIDMDAAAESLRLGLQAGSMQKMMFSRGMLDLPADMIRHKPDNLGEVAACRTEN
jgi:S-adenosylmethionine decarboxylase